MVDLLARNTDRELALDPDQSCPRIWTFSQTLIEVKLLCVSTDRETTAGNAVNIFSFREYYFTQPHRISYESEQ